MGEASKSAEGVSIPPRKTESHHNTTQHPEEALKFLVQTRKSQEITRFRQSCRFSPSFLVLLDQPDV